MLSVQLVSAVLSACGVIAFASKWLTRFARAGMAAATVTGALATGVAVPWLFVAACVMMRMSPAVVAL